MEGSCRNFERKVELCTKGRWLWKTGSKIGEEPTALFARTHGQNNTKLATLKISARLNMQRQRKNDEALNATKGDGTT